MYPLAAAQPQSTTIPISRAVEAIGAVRLHEQGIKGQGVKVAVLDTGVSQDHKMIKHNIIHAESMVAGESAEDGISGHGSWVASAIAGVPTQSPQGTIYGVAPEAELIIIKVLSDKGTGSMAGVVAGMERAVDLGADIISMSLGSLFGTNLSPDSRTLNELASRYGVLFVVAVGNAFAPLTVGSPGCAAMSIGVGAVAMDLPINGAPATFSSKGPTLDGIVKPNISTYGGNVVAQGLSELLYAAGAHGGYTSMAGTCLTKDTNIYTPDGPIELKDLNIGDYVYSFDGSQLVTNKIDAILDQGVKEVYELITADGRQIIATGNHPILMRDHNRHYWKRLDQIKLNDGICLANNIPENPVPELDDLINMDIAKALGYFLADGWISRDRKSRKNYMISTAMDGDLSSLGIELKTYESGKWKYTYSKRLALALSLLGFKQPHNKAKLPKWIYHISKIKKQKFIEGFMFGDGHEREQRPTKEYDVELASQWLIRDLKLLCDWVGYRAGRVRHRNRIIKPPNSKEPMMWGTWGLCISTGYTPKTSQVKSIKQLGKEPVYDLTIPPNHNFVANGIIVHNSMATPICSGALALLLSAGVKRDRMLMEELFARTGGIFLNTVTGWGMLNAEKLLNTARAGVAPLVSVLGSAPYILTQPLFQLMPKLKPERDTIRIQIIR